MIKNDLIHKIGLMLGVMDNPYFGEPRRSGMIFNPDYRPERDNKELREFTIKGEKIMAYSRKDAIKRLKHKKK
jgi:hypothetical protein